MVVHYKEGYIYIPLTVSHPEYACNICDWTCIAINHNMLVIFVAGLWSHQPINLIILYTILRRTVNKYLGTTARWLWICSFESDLFLLNNSLTEIPDDDLSLVKEALCKKKTIDKKNKLLAQKSPLCYLITNFDTKTNDKN